MYVYYLTHVFITSTPAFNLLIRVFNLPTRAFNLATRAFSLVTRGFEFVTRGLELVTRRFEIATHISELATGRLVTSDLLFRVFDDILFILFYMFICFLFM